MDNMKGMKGCGRNNATNRRRGEPLLGRARPRDEAETLHLASPRRRAKTTGDAAPTPQFSSMGKSAIAATRIGMIGAGTVGEFYDFDFENSIDRFTHDFALLRIACKHHLTSYACIR
jgi:hypothetical protein